MGHERLIGDFLFVFHDVETITKPRALTLRNGKHEIEKSKSTGFLKETN